MARWKQRFLRLREWAKRSWKLLLGLGAGAAAIVAILTAWDKVFGDDEEPVPRARNAELVRVGVVQNRTLAQYRDEFGAAARTVPKPCKGFKQPDDPQGAGASIPPNWHASLDGPYVAQEPTDPATTTDVPGTTTEAPTTTTAPEPRIQLPSRVEATPPEQLVGRGRTEPGTQFAEQVAMRSEEEREQIVAGLQSGGEAAAAAQRKLVEATLGDVVVFKVRLVGLLDHCIYTRSVMLDNARKLIESKLLASRDALFYTAVNEDDSSTGSLWVPRPRRGQPFQVRLEVFDDRPQLLEERTTRSFPRD